jgi:hypothetical protein
MESPFKMQHGELSSKSLFVNPPRAKKAKGQNENDWKSRGEMK